jgi:hypothetical protein
MISITSGGLAANSRIATSARNSGVTPYRLASARNSPVAKLVTGRMDTSLHCSINCVSLKFPTVRVRG